MAKQTSGTFRTFALAATVLAMMMAISFIPPLYAEDFTLRRTNIFSELYSFGDSKPERLLPPEVDVDDFDVDMDDVAEQVAVVQEQIAPTAETSISWNMMSEDMTAYVADTLAREPAEAVVAAAFDKRDFLALLPSEEQIVKVEDFGDSLTSPLQLLYDKLLSGKAVHIGFMGDSFTENDILTADLRSMLQELFGGGGVGYAPFASPHASYRRTVKTTSSGWKPYHIILDSRIPEPYSGDFFVSGWVARASEGASTLWQLTDAVAHSSECDVARLYFIARHDAELQLSLDERDSTFTVVGGEQVRQVVLRKERIASLRARVLSGAEGFTAIGAEFYSEGGISLDNLSIRSNNGQALLRSNPSVNAQINQMHPYDLIILQYGLNILTAERKNYSLYAEQVVKIVRYVEQCFPGAAIIIMGVSDRSAKDENGNFVPMESARNLAWWQREAADSCGVAFWNTHEAMRRKGGMDAFVEKGWAGKDYTHIGYGGGRQVARSMFHALVWGVHTRQQHLRREELLRQPVLTDSVKDSVNSVILRNDRDF